MDKVKQQKLVELRQKSVEKQELDQAHRQELIDAIYGLHALFTKREEIDIEVTNQLLDKLSEFKSFKEEVIEVQNAIKALPKVENVSVNNLSELIDSQKEIDLSEVIKAVNNLSTVVEKNSVKNTAISNKKPEDFIPTRRVREVNRRLVFDDDPLQVTVVGGGGGATIAGVQPELIENGMVKVTTQGAVTERYDLSDSEVIYTATAVVGTNESASSWTIIKYDLTDTANSSGKVALNAAWSDRLTETYS